MTKTIFFIVILFAKLSFSQIDDIPIDNSETWGSYDKMAISTNLKNAYPLALWLNDFNKYIPDLKEINSLSEIGTGYYHITMKSYCIRPGKPVGGNGGGTAFGPLKGKKSKIISGILNKAANHPEIEQKYVQTLIWGIIAGLSYSDYPADFKKKIDPLLTAAEKKESGIKLNELLDLIPDELKGQFGIFNDIRSLVKEGINRFEELESIAVPIGTPEVSSRDINIEPGQFTLFEDGSYIRATPVLYSNTGVEIYKPDAVNVIFDVKGRIIQMESSSGKINIEYDDNQGADIITRESGNYKINRISVIKLDGIEIDNFKDALWTIPYDHKESNGSGYSRIFDPPIGVYEEREKNAFEFIELIKQYNTKKKFNLKESDISSLFELKQFELCIKWMADNNILNREQITPLISISMDASLNKIGDVVYKNKLSSGSQKLNAPELGGLVVMFGADGTQNIVIAPDGGNEPKIPRVYLHNVNCETLPEPGGMFTASLEIVNNDRPIQEIVIDLYDISTERGRYLNDKEQRADVGPDMVFDPELNTGYRIVENSGSPPWFTAIGDGSSPLQVTIKSRDFGGFAKLKATVKINGIVYNATADVFGTHINVPCDNDNDHITDKWESDNNVTGLPPDWDDEDNPSGQQVTGDGMTLYEEYRGFYELLPDGTPQHVRLDPNKKEIFAIDDDFLLSTYSWEHASGIPVYRVNEAFVYGTLCGGDMAVIPRYRLLNFCSGYSAGVKYAVNVVKINGTDDPYNLCGTDTTYDGCSLTGPPILANITIILPERSRRYLESIRNTLQQEYNDDTSSTSYYIEGVFLEHNIMLSCLHALTDPAEFSLLLEFYVKTCAVHEVGHACGIKHHSPETSGDQDCPMRYYEYFDPLRLFARYYRDAIQMLNEGITPMVALGTLHFCTNRDNCWSQINVNDRRP